jgi:hypothetical protein
MGLIFHCFSGSLRRSLRRFLFVVRAEAYDAFDTSAVVPASIEEDELLRRREMRGVTLKVPAAAVMQLDELISR